MTTVDIHAHWYPEEWLPLFSKDGAQEGASLERKEGGGFMLRAKNITNAFDERFVVVDERVKAMDQRRIDIHALSLTTPMVYWASSVLCLALRLAVDHAPPAGHTKHPHALLAFHRRPVRGASQPPAGPPRTGDGPDAGPGSGGAQARARRQAAGHQG